MAHSNKNIEAYIAKILEIQEKHSQKPVSQEEMKQIASELGISADDWKNIDKAYDDHWKRGNGYVNHKNWDDAIEELQQAFTLKPNEPAVLYMLAKAYQGRWKDFKRKNDKEEAIRYAQQCLQVKADHAGALKLVSDLKRNIIPLRNKSYSGNKKKSSVGSIIGVLMGLSLLVGLMGWFTNARNESTSTPNKVYNSAPATSSSSSSSSSSNSKKVDLELPVSLVKNEKSEGFELKIESSLFTITRYSTENFSYKFLGDLSIKGYEISLLKMKVEVLDSKGNVAKTDFLDLVSKHKPTVRSGDIIPLTYSKYYSNQKAPDWKSVQISVEIIQKQKLSDNLVAENYPKVDLNWGSSKSANFNLDVTQRETKFTPSTYGGTNKVYHKLVLMFKNTGNYSIKNLKAEIQWLGQDNSTLESKTIYVNSSSKPSIKPGQGRTFQGTWAIEGISKGSQIKNYKVVITDIN